MDNQELRSWMEHCITFTAAGYSCLRGPRPSGAITIDIDTLPTYGYVQPPHGSTSCVEEDECMMEDGHCVRNLHAEVHAILSAHQPGTSLAGGIMFSINKPCYNCTLHIIAAGIKTVYYAYAVYDEERTQQALEAASVECIHVPVD